MYMYIYIYIYRHIFLYVHIANYLFCRFAARIYLVDIKDYESKLLEKCYKLFLLFKSRGYFALFLFFYFVSLRVLGKRTKSKSLDYDWMAFTARILYLANATPAKYGRILHRSHFPIYVTPF